MAAHHNMDGLADLQIRNVRAIMANARKLQDSLIPDSKAWHELEELQAMGIKLLKLLEPRA